MTVCCRPTFAGRLVRLNMPDDELLHSVLFFLSYRLLERNKEHVARTETKSGNLLATFVI